MTMNEIEIPGVGAAQIATTSENRMSSLQKRFPDDSMVALVDVEVIDVEVEMATGLALAVVSLIKYEILLIMVSAFSTNPFNLATVIAFVFSTTTIVPSGLIEYLNSSYLFL